MSWESQAISLLSASLVRPVIVATAAGLAIRLFRVRHPASRHAIWAAVLAALFLLPVVSVFAPHWDVPLLPGKQVPAAIVQSPPIFAVETEQPVQIVEAPVAASRTVSARSKFTMPLVLWIYFAGLLAMTLYHVTGWVLLRRLIGKSKTLRGGVLRESEDVAAPVAVGVLRPAVILPPGWGEWNRETRQAVLAHEFAHLRRGDTRVAALARVVKTVMWFHPLAWWVAKHVMELAEQACDAAGLKRAGDPAGYSRVLLAFGSGVNRAGYRVGMPGLAMAGSASGMAKRIDGIFELADGKLRKLARPGLVLGLVGLPVMCAAATLGFTASKILVLPAMSPKAPEAPELKIAPQVKTRVAAAPAPESVDPNLQFDVASVRMLDPVEPNTNGGFRMSGGPGTPDPEHIRYTNASIFQILTRLLRLQGDQIIGPQWVMQPFGAERFDVTANVKPGATPQQVSVMLLNLLKERFHLAYHMEKRNLDAYELVVAKGGSKLKDAEIPAELPVPERGKPAQTFKGEDGFPDLPAGWPEGVGLAEGSSMSLFFDIKNTYGFRLAPSSPTFGAGGKLIIWRIGMRMVTIPELTDWLQAFEGIAHIVDRTGLAGAYDIKLRFANGGTGGEEGAGEPAPDVYEALEKQLGLKLQKAKAPFDVMVIDRIDKTPVEN